MITRQTRKHAFTLVELLVVISVIVILAAIMFPVFGRARENARRAACMNNLKTVGLGLLQYVQDYDERQPSGSLQDLVYNFNTSGNEFPTVHRTLFPYVKILAAYNCPSAVAQTIPAQAPDSISSTSYLWNAVMLQYSGGSALAWGWRDQPAQKNANAGIPMSVISSPSEIICMQEFPYKDNRAVMRPAAYADATYKKVAAWCFYGSGSYAYNNEHFGGGNLLFLDGHVKWRTNASLRAKEFGLAVNNTAAVPVPSNDAPSPTNCYTDGTGLPAYRTLF